MFNNKQEPTVSDNTITLQTAYAGLLSVNKPTTSSVEAVRMINEFRLAENPNAKVLRHANFIRDIKQEFGGAELKFESSYIDNSGKRSKCYELPERELHIMLMSESPAARARIYDQHQARGQAIISLLNIVSQADKNLLDKKPSFKPYRDSAEEERFMLYEQLRDSGVRDPEVFNLIGYDAPTEEELQRIQEYRKSIQIQPKKPRKRIATTTKNKR